MATTDDGGIGSRLRRRGRGHCTHRKDGDERRELEILVRRGGRQESRSESVHEKEGERRKERREEREEMREREEKEI